MCNDLWQVTKDILTTSYNSTPLWVILSVSTFFSIFLAVLMYHSYKQHPKAVKKYLQYSEKELLAAALIYWRNAHFDCPGWRERATQLVELDDES